MKSKTTASINIVLLMISCVTAEHSIFYKGKFFLFHPSEDEVDVYEEFMIPYITHIENVFQPKPEGNITRVFSPVKNKIIIFETSDGKKWYYERFKLRRTE